MTKEKETKKSKSMSGFELTMVLIFGIIVVGSILAIIAEML